jgi:DNA ligase-1
MKLSFKVALALSLALLCKVSWSFQYPSPSQFPENQAFIYHDWLMSEKFDGVRAIWDGESLLTRNQHRIYAPDWFIQSLPKFALDGELWLGYQRFSEVSSMVRVGSDHPGWQNVKYLVFEVPQQLGGLLQRLNFLHDYLKRHPSNHIQVIDQLKIVSEDHLNHYYQRVLHREGEGLIIRDGSLSYQTGRLRSMFKLKPYQDAECRVEGYRPGKGKYQGEVGALLCRLLPSVQARLFPQLAKQDQLILLGSGLSDELRKFPPTVGTVVTFRYNGLTRKGKPRFARFLRVRLIEGSN